MPAFVRAAVQPLRHYRDNQHQLPRRERGELPAGSRAALICSLLLHARGAARLARRGAVDDLSQPPERKGEGARTDAARARGSAHAPIHPGLQEGCEEGSRRPGRARRRRILIADKKAAADYYPWFDWLRLALACIVLAGHQGLFPRWPKAPDFAVQVFFALSGWLIGGLLVKM